MDNFFGEVTNLVFFASIKDYLTHEATYLMNNILGNTYALLGGVLLTMMTIWVFIHGYRIMSGQSREPLMGFMLTVGKAVAIITVATAVGSNTSNLFTDITEGIQEGANYLVNGSNAKDPYDQIDKNLAMMQTGLGAMRSLDTGDDPEVLSQKNQAIMMSAAGVAGPAIVAGTMLLVNRFAWALFVGFAPIFILCLLFDQTKNMFTKWINFGIGISISLAVISFMTAIAMKMVLALTGVVLAQNFLEVSNGGFTGAAMQQGGLGLVLTALLVTVPSMASNFVGQFASNFGGSNLFGGGGYGHKGQEAAAKGATGFGSSGGAGGGVTTSSNAPSADNNSGSVVCKAPCAC